MLRLCPTLNVASILCLLISLPVHSGHAQTRHHPALVSQNANNASLREVRTTAAMEKARSQGPLALYAFLYNMPKGGDLHNHLFGAVYAESWLRNAATDHLCIDVNAHAIAQSGDRSQHPDPPRCDPQAEARVVNGIFPAASLGDNQPLYDALINSFSMRSFVPSDGNSGHDHFFASFDKFEGISLTHMPEWIDEIATRAAEQNEQYLELMHTPPFQAAARIAREIDFTQDFAADRDKMIARGLRDQTSAIRSDMDRYMHARRELEHCDGPSPGAGCAVTVRFLYQVLRNFPPPIVFAQILLGFEVAANDPQHFLGINLVQPEDDFYAMRDYRMHMQMIAVLRRFYPSVHVTLHAGEVAPGLVEPEGLTFHIRDAVETAGAERIGHGVDVMYENHAGQLLQEMATRRTMVEINLTSNDGILNVSGDRHPLPSYLAAGVPVALATDDEGVNRSNMTHEYTRALATYGIRYSAIKKMVRNSIAFSFLPGEPLWPVTDQASMYRRPATPCASSIVALGRSAAAKADAACSGLLASSEKAAQQWILEQRFAAFEASEPSNSY